MILLPVHCTDPRVFLLLESTAKCGGTQLAFLELLKWQAVDRKIDRRRDRQTVRQKKWTENNQMDRETNRLKIKAMDRDTIGLMYEWVDGWMKGWTYRWTDRLSARWKDCQTDGQTDRQKDRWMDLCKDGWMDE